MGQVRSLGPAVRSHSNTRLTDASRVSTPFSGPAAALPPQVLEPGGYTAPVSHSNSNMLIHPAYLSYRLVGLVQPFQRQYADSTRWVRGQGHLPEPTMAAVLAACDAANCTEFILTFPNRWSGTPIRDTS